jgi:hypothetical protein
MQCKHTWYALGFRNQNPRHGETAPLLGESTPPQWVNGLIILNPYLLDPWRWFAGSCLCYPFFLAYIALGLATLHSHGC